MKDINSLIEDIGHILLDSVPVVYWEKIVLEACIISSFHQINAYYYNENIKISFDPNEGKTQEYDIGQLLAELREKTYDYYVNKGAWYTISMLIESDGKFNVKYEYDLKPNFTYEPENEKYIEDMKRFPRENDLIPTWLKNML